MNKIAIVEDNPDNRLLVRAILEGHFELTEYSTGTAALDGIDREPPDLVLLDISLPEMDGTEVLKRLRAEPRWESLPVIALTAHAMSGDRERLLGLGFDAYISKPILDPKLLVQTMESLLEGRRFG